MNAEAKKNAQYDLNILLLKEDDSWIAQCLDYDINAQADSIKDSITLLIETFKMRFEYDIQNGIEPLSEVLPAPYFYYDLFNNKAEPLEFDRPFQIPSNSADSIHRGRTLARVC